MNSSQKLVAGVAFAAVAAIATLAGANAILDNSVNDVKGATSKVGGYQQVFK